MLSSLVLVLNECFVPRVRSSRGRGDEEAEATSIDEKSDQLVLPHAAVHCPIGWRDSDLMFFPLPYSLSSGFLSTWPEITFVFPDHPERQPIQKKLSGKHSRHWNRGAAVFKSLVIFVHSAVFMELQKMRGLLHRLLKVPAADLKLTYSSPKVRPHECLPSPWMKRDFWGIVFFNLWRSVESNICVGSLLW